jgi:uncharacterized protein YlxP (DUF503 family)
LFVGIARLVFFIHGCNSLKGKRQVVRSIKDRVRARFDVAIAEVGGLDLWQRTEIGICSVGNDHAHVNSVLDNVTRFIENMMVAQLTDRSMEIISWKGEGP